MRLRKAFTLAEILIVLMVIGALATLTIPAMMRGVNESQWKTSYKKAYNAIVNLCAMERIAGNLPSTPDATGIKKMFTSMKSNLAVKDFAADLSSAGEVYPMSSFLQESDLGESATGDKYWLITEDNLAYIVFAGAGTGTGEGEGSKICNPKATINSQTSLADAISNTCVYLLVDVNGLGNGPNVVEPQSNSDLSDTEQMATLTGDRFYIFVGRDGATAGNKTHLVSGRIAGDIK